MLTPAVFLLQSRLPFNKPFSIIRATFIGFLLLLCCLLPIQQAKAVTVDFDYPYLNDFESLTSIHDNEADTDPTNDLNGQADWTLEGDWGINGAHTAWTSSSGSFHLDNNPLEEDQYNHKDGQLATMNGYVEIPLASINPVLNYRYKFDITPQTKMYVEVQIKDSTTWEILQTYTDQHNHDQYALEAFDLSDYKGQSIRLRFRQFNHGDYGPRLWVIDDVYMGELAPTLEDYDFPYLNDFESLTSTHDSEVDNDPANDINGQADWNLQGDWGINGPHNAWTSASGAFHLDNNPAEENQYNHKDGQLATMNGYVEIPSSSVAPVLNYHYKLLLDYVGDRIFVEVQAQGTNTWEMLTYYALENNVTNYTQETVGLSAFKGQSIRIRFRQHNNATQGSRLWVVDNVYIGELILEDYDFPYHNDFETQASVHDGEADSDAANDVNGRDDWNLQGDWGINGAHTAWTSANGVFHLDNNPDEEDQSAHNSGQLASMKGYVEIPDTSIAPILSYNYKFDSIASSDSMYVEVQALGSSSWTVVQTYKQQNNQSNYTQETLDLSAYKGQSIRIRFRQYNDWTNGTRLWAIDDFFIGELALEDYDYPYANNFESPTSTHDNEADSDPANDINGQADWNLQGDWGINGPHNAWSSASGAFHLDNNPGEEDQNVHKDTQFATMLGYVDIPANSVSPVVAYRYKLNLVYSVDEVDVEIQAKNSPIWTSLHSYTEQKEQTTYTQEILDLSAYQGQSIRLRFKQYNGWSSGPRLFVVDEFYIGNLALADYDFPYINNFESLTSTHDSEADNDPANDINGQADWNLQGDWGINGPHNAWSSASGSFHLDNNPIEEDQYSHNKGHLATLMGYVDIPAGSISPVLSYHYKLALDAPGDRMKVEIQSKGTNTWALLTAYAPADNATSPTQATLDLSVYKGQSIRVRFRQYNRATHAPRLWVIDDLRIEDTATGPIGNHAPNITSTAPTVATEDLAYNYPVTAIDPDAGDVISFSLNIAPNGMNIDPITGLISWVPTHGQVGANNVSIRVTDTAGLSDVQSFVVTVTSINDAPSIVSTAPTIATEDLAYSYSVIATDPDNGDSLSYTLDVSPVGMAIDPTVGVISWVPNNGQVSAHNVTVRVTDTGGLFATQSFTITATAANINDGPVINSTPITVATQGILYNYTVVATDEDIGDSLLYSLTIAPVGMSIDSSTALIQWTPVVGQEGQHEVELQVTDGINPPVVQVFTITVLELNVAPVISSSPIVNAQEGQAYSYQIEAQDANQNDVLSFALLQSPAGMAIGVASGLIDWTPTDLHQGNNLASNSQCMLPQPASTASPSTVDIVVMVDESGSMDTEQAWVRDFIHPLEANLNSAGVGLPATPNQYGLIGFGAANAIPRSINLNGQLMNVFGEFEPAAEELVVSGGFEDGWAAMIHALDNYPLRDSAVRNFILITDEDRDDLGQTYPQYDVSYEEMLQRLIDNRVVLNVAVDIRFNCGDSRPALGMNAQGLGFVANGRNYDTCANATPDVSNIGSTAIQDYVNMALATGGAAWDLGYLRSGGDPAIAFSKALREIKVDEITQQRPAILQTDLVVSSLLYNGDHSRILVNVSNRGLAPSGETTLDLYADVTSPGTRIGQAAVPVLNPAQSIGLEFTLTGQLPATTQYLARLQTPVATQECELDNNSLSSPLITLQVSDSGQLSDTQSYLLAVSDSNQAPAIISTPPTTVSIAAQYSYQVEVQDPDVGDALSFVLVTSPPGMQLDALTGLLSYTPSPGHAGDHNVEIQVIDLGGLAASQQYTLVVDENYAPPIIVSAPLAYGVIDTVYSYQPQVEADPTAELSFAMIYAPEGMQINGQSGEIQWPVPASLYQTYDYVAFQVTDQFGNTDVQSYKFHIDHLNAAPSISSEPVTRIGSTQNYGYTPAVSDTNYYEEHTWSIETGLSGFTVWEAPNGTQNVRAVAADFAPLLHEPMSTDHSECYLHDSNTPNVRPVVEWSFNNGRREFNQPLVVPLHDSNNDGMLNHADQKFIITSSYRAQNSSAVAPVIHLLSMNGAPIWEYSAEPIDWHVIPAVADLDQDNYAEIILKTTNGEILVLDYLGNEKWRSVPGMISASGRYGMITVADLEGDGDVEIIVGGTVADHNGNLLWQITDADLGHFYALPVSLPVDLDQDGTLELLYNDAVYDALGNRLWDIPKPSPGLSVRNAYFALVNTDQDSNPEVVISAHYFNHGSYISLMDHDGDVVWQIPSQISGPLNIADVDHDSQPEIFNSAEAALYDISGVERWRRPSQTTGRGAVLVDLNQDGYLEYLYHHIGLRVVDAATGITKAHNSTDTLTNTPYAALAAHATPVVVNMNDGTGAKIILADGGYVRMLGNDSLAWPGVAGSKMINQYFYRESADAADTLSSINPITQNNLAMTSFQRTGGVIANAITHYQSDLVPINLRIEENEANGSYTLSVDIKNRGLANVDTAFDVVFRKDTSTGPEIGRVQVPSLAVTQTTTVSVSGLLNENLGQFVYTVIENASAIDECVTDNNAMSAAVMRLTVSDKENLSDLQLYNLTVIEASWAPVKIDVVPANAMEGVEYHFFVPASDPNVGDFVRFKPITLPTGAKLNQISGELVWTPPFGSAGNHSLRLHAVDLADRHITWVYTLTVVPNNDPHSPPAFNSNPIVTARIGQLYTYAAIATDPDGSDVSYVLTQSPTGMRIDPVSGLINWAPGSGQLGQHTVVIEATDIRATQATQAFTITVTGNEPPQITSSVPLLAYPDVLYRFNLQAVDPDGDALVFQLVTAPTGMVLDEPAGQINWTPDAAQLGAHPVQITASDGQFTTTISYTLTVVEQNTAPFIDSLPLTHVIADQPYQYAVQAFDRENDLLSYVLVVPPAGMTIDGQGIVNWLPGSGQIGSHAIQVDVNDGRGGFVNQQYTLVVNDGIINQPPEILSSAPQSVVEGETFIYQLLASDPGDILDYALVTGPNGATIDSDGLLLWMPPTGNSLPFYQEFQIEVSDGQLTAWQRFVVAVTDGGFNSQELVVSIALDRHEYQLNELLEFRVNATGSELLTTSLTINGATVAIGDTGIVRYTLDQFGRYEITATASSATQTLTATDYVSVIDPSDTVYPVVAITAPTDGEVITKPVEIIGTASDANLRYYRLAHRRKGSDNWHIQARQTSNVTDGVLGQFDPSLLENGIYDLLVEAMDDNGRLSTDSITLRVEGQLKVGHFSYTVEDLNIPVSGIPIRVTRTYDSRRRTEPLDFGYGWSIGYQDIKIDESRKLGQFWQLNQYNSGFKDAIVHFCVEPQGAPQVTITLPDGRTETFDAHAEPSCSLFVPRLDVQVEFRSLDGESTLVLRDPIIVRFAGDRLAVIGGDDIYDPDEYLLTTREGFIYTLKQGVGIETVTDPNGNTLTYTDNGIFHSDGKSVLFNRDSSGRISTITDPLGNTLNYGYDADGDLHNTIDPLGNASLYHYQGDHYLSDITDPLGRTIVKNIYDDNGRLIAQEDNNGNRTDFNHDIAGRQSIITDRLGRSTQLFYDDRGNLTSQVDALGNLSSFTFDADDNQTSQTDPLGHTRTATYNDSRDQLTQSDELGNTISFSYNPRGQELTVQDARSNLFEIAYDSFGNLLTITDPLGNNTFQNIGAKGNVLLRQDALGNETTFSYDDAGNVLTETDPLGNTTTRTYDANGNALSETRSRLVDNLPVAETTHYVYDAQNRVIQTTDALGNITRTEYDIVGNEVARIDALGQHTDMTYDAYRRLLTTSYPDATTETNTYDAEGKLIDSTDRAGRTTQYTYDALDRQISVTYPNNNSTQTEYDAAGRVTAEIDANGNRTVYDYDAAGRRTVVTDALGNVTSMTYDADGNLLSQIDANSHTVSYQYDSLDRRIQTTNPDSRFMTEGYDPLGRLASKTDQAGKTTSYEYDALGRLAAVVDALLQRTEYRYDKSGNKLTQTDANGNTTSWTYDALGRALSRTLPLGQTETFGYNANGNQAHHTDFNGNITHFTYDINDRLNTKTYTDNSVETTTYDLVGNRADVTDNRGTTRYLYDSRDRLIKETQPDGNIIEYGYDAAGNRTQVTTTVSAVEETVSYDYDALNRLGSVTDASTQITTYSYDGVGNRATISYPNGITTTYTYDSLNRLTTTETQDNSNSVIARYNYTLTATGHRNQMIELTGATTTYTYDNLYRLIGEDLSNHPVLGSISNSYQYDPVGNRTFSVEDGVSTAYSHDTNDRLQTAGGETYIYDANGNTLTSAIDNTVTTNSYNNNRLTQMIKTENAVEVDNVSYQYDSDGLRIATNDDGVTTHYLVDKNRDYGQVLKELDSTNTETVSYLYGDDLIKQTRSANDSYYLYDGLGSTRSLTDSLGNVTDTYDYSAYGTLIDNTGSTENNYRYTGEQYDASLGNYYLRARYYDPSTGRFTQMDTFQGWMNDPTSLHKYAYGNMDPINHIDPSGNISIAQFGAAMAISGILITAASPQYGSSASGSLGGSVGRSNIGAVVSAGRFMVYLATIGFGPMLNGDHPDHWEENEALGMTGWASCSELAWAIDILRRGIAWRKADLDNHPEDWSNMIGKGHRDRINNMQDKLNQLEQAHSDKGC